MSEYKWFLEERRDNSCVVVEIVYDYDVMLSDDAANDAEIYCLFADIFIKLNLYE